MFESTIYFERKDLNGSVGFVTEPDYTVPPHIKGSYRLVDLDGNEVFADPDDESTGNANRVQLRLNFD